MFESNLFCLIFSLFSFNKYKNTGSVQQISLPKTTFVKMECWGAQGGNEPSSDGGRGAYTVGITSINLPVSFYIYIGGQGEGRREGDRGTQKGGWNGGGTTGAASGGGGSTDVRTTNGSWSNFNSLKSRIMVAAAGSGADLQYKGLYAGTLTGITGRTGDGKGGMQTSGGAGGNTAASAGGFGFGANSSDGGGAGSGYYGGGASIGNEYIGGTGCSFISGHSGCNAISSSSTSSNIVHTGQPNHYSGYVFTNTVMKAGNEVMPSPTGGTETGHSGNGYCKITWHPAL